MKVKKIDFCHMQSKEISIREIYKYIFLPVIVRSTYHTPVQVRRGAPPASVKPKKKKMMLCSVVPPLPSCSLSSKVAALSVLPQPSSLSLLTVHSSGWSSAPSLTEWEWVKKQREREREREGEREWVQMSFKVWGVFRSDPHCLNSNP